MAPKNKSKGKDTSDADKSKGGKGGGGSGGGLKPANSINVRHILVCFPRLVIYISIHLFRAYLFIYCYLYAKTDS